MYHILKHGSGGEKQALLKVIGNHSASYDELLAVSKAVHTSGAFELGKRMIRVYFRDSQRMIHENFPKSSDRDMLSSMSNVIISNKFLAILKQSRE